MAKPGSAFNATRDVETSSGLNPGLIVLIVVLGSLVVFLVGNFFLYQYAQKNLPAKKKKPVSKKKLKKEKLKAGVRPPGD
ncbi:DNA-binding protein S1FA [Physcomitrium patens]|uniref:DNA-binding protein S1FA n=1 Tax=Physcomitrium patens TaxID=3218 RepID=A0A2K1JIX2_PHYPA|nr:DNA-binding protein S1FA-like [Physcomitrium patens]PNR41495.1 hypothetical protein PHYPA_018898 [Physcomitrium patens]|eukprot:XP_024393659.1 DNA-binding protein S1FA-like [Physcomitrella patens]